MASFKQVWAFHSREGGAWTEQYWRSSDGLTSAANVPDALIVFRLKMLNEDNTLDEIVTQTTDAQRITVVQPVNQLGINPDAPEGGTGAPPQQNPAPDGAAIVAHLETAGHVKRKLWLRGINAGDYAMGNAGNTFNFHPNFVSNFAVWATGLAARGYGIRKLKPVNAIGNPQFKVLGIDGTAANGTSKVTLAGAVTMDATKRIIFARSAPKNLPGFNGHFSVLDVTGLVYTIPYVTPENRLIATGQLGFAHGEQYLDVSLFDPNQCFLERMATRQTRNFVFHSRGARRAQRVRGSA